MKNFILLILLILGYLSSNAAHIIGGELYIEWIAQNQYIIHSKIYYDNNTTSAAVLPNQLIVGIYETGTNNLDSTYSIPLISSTLVNLGDPCYTPNIDSVSIQQGIYESAIITIPNYIDGYYLQGEIYARNYLALNLNISAGNPQGMSFFCQIPDPAIGQNSSPVLGIYPADAYFCVASGKTFNFNVTDPDGDSLYYELTEPLRSVNTGTLPFVDSYAGSGPYPYYPSVPWLPGYSLNNILGGTPMTINPTTGDITANPSILGFFTFAVKVEEYRNSVKIGEIRRDIQYRSLICQSGSPPTFLNTSPTSNETLQIEYNKQYCKDLIFDDSNFSDTLYIEMVSTIFDSGAYIPSITPDANGDLHYFYNGSGNPFVWNDSVVIPPNQINNEGTFNIGTIASRFCWTPTCNQIGKFFPFQINAFSLGCDGKSQDSILFNIEVVPPNIDFKNLSDQLIPYGEEYCRNIVFHDTSIVDVLKIEINSEIFSLGATFTELPNNFQYNNDVYPSPNDIIITNVPNGANNIVNLAKRFCWTPDCAQIGNSYNIKAYISSADCFTAKTIKDTIDFNYIVIPPHSRFDTIPNVITPNGDGLNDFFTLGYTNDNGKRIGGIPNPCNDEINIKIYNRWGSLVYESEEYPEFEWDGTNKSGKKVSAGTYFIVINGTYGSKTIILSQRTITVLNPQ